VSTTSDLVTSLWLSSCEK